MLGVVAQLAKSDFIWLVFMLFQVGCMSDMLGSHSRQIYKMAGSFVCHHGHCLDGHSCLCILLHSPGGSKQSCAPKKLGPGRINFCVVLLTMLHGRHPAFECAC